MRTQFVKSELPKANRVIEILTSIRNLTAELNGIVNNVGNELSEHDQSINDIHHILYLERDEELDTDDKILIMDKLDEVLFKRRDLKALDNMVRELRKSGLNNLATINSLDTMRQVAYTSLYERSVLYKVRTCLGADIISDIYTKRNKTVPSTYKFTDEHLNYIKDKYSNADVVEDKAVTSNTQIKTEVVEEVTSTHTISDTIKNESIDVASKIIEKLVECEDNEGHEEVEEVKEVTEMIQVDVPKEEEEVSVENEDINKEVNVEKESVNEVNTAQEIMEEEYSPIKVRKVSHQTKEVEVSGTIEELLKSGKIPLFRGN